MGWSSGSCVMSRIISGVFKTGMDYEDRYSLYKVLIKEFERADCDTLCECTGEDMAFDAVYFEMYPREEDDWSEDDATLYELRNDND